MHRRRSGAVSREDYAGPCSLQMDETLIPDSYRWTDSLPQPAPVANGGEQEQHLELLSAPAWRIVPLRVS